MKTLTRLFSVFLILTMFANTAFADTFKYGDGDGDSIITASDAVAAVLNRLQGSYIKCLDVNGDGKLTLEDEELIIQKALNDDFIFPVETMSEEFSDAEGSSEVTTSSSSDNETEAPTEKPTEEPTEAPTEKPTEEPTEASTEEPTEAPTEKPTEKPTEAPTEKPTEEPTEASTEEPTEEPTETSTVDSSYNKVWNISDFVSSGEFAKGETISSDVTKDGLTFIASTTSRKSSSIIESSVTVDEKSYAYALKFGGGGSSTSMAISFDVKGDTVIELVTLGGANRKLTVAGENGEALGSIEAPATATVGTLSINYTGKVYIYSAGSSISIYNIKRTAAGSSGDDTPPTEASSEAPSEASTEDETEATTLGSEYGVQGFAKAGLSDLDTSGYTVYEANDAKSFLDAVVLANKNTSTSSGTIIKVTADLSLGYNEVTNTVSTSYSTGVFKELAKPLLHPTLMETGVSQITLSGTNIVIYSPNGNKIKHTNIVISGASNVVIRNLTFCELWEWDEYSFGHYDRNDWDYIGIQSSSSRGSSKNIWIDHCTFKKSYDGIVDSKGGSTGLSVTWCKFESDEAFVREQINYLEEHIDDAGSVTLTNNTGAAIEALGLTADTSAQVSPYANVLYRYLRLEAGLSTEDIIQASLPQQKSHLVGSSDSYGSSGADNVNLEITLAYNWYENSRDRMPRLRAGNAHIYNCVIDSSTSNTVYNANKTALAKAASISGITGDGSTTEKFDFSSTSQAFVTTENGAMAVENCVVNGVTSPVKNNQSKANDDYTGKFKAENVLVNGTLTTWDGSQDAIDNDKSNPLYPTNSYSAAAKVFSWNATPNYSESTVTPYEAVDPSKLEEKLTGNVGAGVVDLDWTKLTYSE